MSNISLELFILFLFLVFDMTRLAASASELIELELNDYFIITFHINICVIPCNRSSDFTGKTIEKT